MVNGAGTTLSNLSTLSLGAGGGTTTLNLELGSAYDSFATTGSASTNGTININLTQIAGFGAGTYNLLSAVGGGLNNATYNFAHG